MQIVNPVIIRANELRTGDIMVAVVTCHVTKRGNGLVYRLYRCPYPPETHEGIPQGNRIIDEEPVMRQLFPVVGWANIEPDLL